VKFSFRRKAREDAAAVKVYCDKELAKFDRKISEDDVKDFCKNIYYIRQFNFKSIEDELNPKKIDVNLLQYEMTNADSTMTYYVLLRCADLFFAKHGYFPGRKESKSMEQDSKELKQIVDDFLKEYGVTEVHSELDGCIKEMVRFGCSENNSVSSLVGGVAAQELIKLSTKQRLPMVNTWLFSGIKGVTNVFKL
jgi:NEDD8-activating enzyme E1 regulatory subunit